MFFFTALQTYSGPGYIDTMVYAYDTVTGELKQFTVPRTDGDTRARNGGVLGYDAENHEIILEIYKADEKTQTEQLFTTGELTYDEDAYVGYSRLVWTGEDYTFKFQKQPKIRPIPIRTRRRSPSRRRILTRREG